MIDNENPNIKINFEKDNDENLQTALLEEHFEGLQHSEIEFLMKCINCIDWV